MIKTYENYINQDEEVYQTMYSIDSILMELLSTLEELNIKYETYISYKSPYDGHVLVIINDNEHLKETRVKNVKHFYKNSELVGSFGVMNKSYISKLELLPISKKDIDVMFQAKKYNI